MSKYKNIKVTTPYDGTFDSQGEYYRYKELQMLQAAGEISDLKRQVPFELIPDIREPDVTYKNGRTKAGRVIERKLVYIADFTYLEGGELIVEDYKGVLTDVFKIKRKLMLYRYGIRIRITKGRG